MRQEWLFNYDWLYTPQQVPLDAPDSAFSSVILPHTNIELPYHNFDNSEYQFISTYRKRFTLPKPLEGRRVQLQFDGAMLVSNVYLNGRQIGVNAGGYTPFTFDITDYVYPESENILQIHLDSTERQDVPPFGFVVDYLTFGGIYRDVFLRYVEPVYVSMTHVQTPGSAEHMQTAPTLRVDLWLENFTNKPVTYAARVIVRPVQFPQTDFMTLTAPLTIPAGRSQHTLELSATEGARLWSLDSPALYTAEITLLHDETALDLLTTRFGFREIAFKANDGFYLNGQRLKLMGLNRHQTFAYMGAAAPKRLQRRDADIVKFELGCNIVRTSHYPQSPYFLERCDEIGLLVLEEIPGWQHIGDDDWKAISLRDVRAMIERDRNHPSIILWGVRINESWDDDVFYTRTNALAHELDATRPTTGIRFFPSSNMLEDVFGYNDFSNTVIEPEHQPHLVTEFNGHMFPTKTFDGEERKIEHARRHAFIQDRQMGMRNVLGAIGWCAFDYNTHREFGSGDRICYHGVMDMFRLPKWAAYVYASQQSPRQRIVLEAATHWTMGDRSGGGNDPLMVLGNVDEIEVFYGPEKLGRFLPDRETYPNLPHPPFNVVGMSMTMIWGQSFGDLRIVGYFNGEAVIEKRLSKDGVPARLELVADFDELQADGMDMTAVTVRFVDSFGNTLPYAMSPVTFALQGDARFIGENPLTPPGGQAAVYVRAGVTAGVVTLTAHAGRLTAQATITLV